MESSLSAALWTRFDSTLAAIRLRWSNISPEVDHGVPGEFSSSKCFFSLTFSSLSYIFQYFVPNIQVARMRSFFTVGITIVGLFILADEDALGWSTKKGRTALFEVRVKPSRAAPILDGVLEKNEWINSTVVNRFTQKEPQEGAPISEPTFVLITYDHENIYFGIRCFDREPEKIVSNNMRLDSDLTDNDYVEIIIDSFHDRRNAYYFATNGRR